MTHSLVSVGTSSHPRSPPPTNEPQTPSPSFPITPSPLPLSPFLPTINLLLQHNTIHARLQQRAHQTRLPLQHTQPIQDLRSGPFRKRGENVGELYAQKSARRDQIRSCRDCGGEKGEGVGTRTLLRLARRSAYSSRTSCSRGLHPVGGSVGGRVSAMELWG